MPKNVEKNSASEMIDRGVLRLLAYAHRRLGPWVRLMDVGRGSYLRPALQRLIKLGLVESRPRSQPSPWLAPEHASSSTPA
jgi:hypothetical protein